MRKSFRLRSLSVILPALFLAACNSASCTKTPTPPVDPQKICSPTSQQPPAVTGTGAVIVTDISGSMKGFVASESTRLYTVHDALERALRDALGSVSAEGTIRRCDLGTGLECRSPHTKEDMHKNIYNAPQSRLDRFFDPEQPGAAPAGKPAQEGGLIDSSRIAVLVTDGVQAQSGSASGKACLGGADPECIAYLLKQRAKDGYGIWLALLLMPFKGTYDAERPLDETHWQRIEEHLSTLPQDSHFQGVTFKADRAQAKAPFRSYQFQGVKPYLVVALSKDWRAGRAFIRQFTENIQKARVTEPADGIYRIELAPLPSQTLQLDNIRQSPGDVNPRIRLIERRRKDGFFDFLVECEREGRTTFILEAKEREEAQTILEGVQMTFNLVPSGDGNLKPESLVVKGELSRVKDEKTGGWIYQTELTCDCRSVTPNRSGEEYKRWLKLQTVLSAQLDASSPWAALHADNTYEKPERFYGLKEIVQKVLEPATAEPRTTDCLQFRLQRK